MGGSAILRGPSRADPLLLPMRSQRILGLVYFPLFSLFACLSVSLSDVLQTQGEHLSLSSQWSLVSSGTDECLLVLGFRKLLQTYMGEAARQCLF